MNLATLSLATMRGARLTQGLNILLLALGLGTVTLLLLFSTSLTNRLVRDAHGIDLVVGAKGSPLQLVLSAVYEADNPTGNIPAAELKALAADPLIARAIPLALGDAVGAFRIVGTTQDYLALYNGTLSAGTLWHAPMEAVLGAEAAQLLHLAPGDHFVGAHGVGGEGEHHGAFPYTVTGVLTPTGTVLDRLVLTSVDSVWQIHAHHMQPGAPREITAVLLQARSPLALISLPHQINSTTPYLAAVPGVEAARLVTLLGAGMGAFRALAWILIAASTLGMLIALLSRLRERRHDLAVLRLLGASPAQLLASVLLEALALAACGAACGLLLGHAGAAALAALSGNAFATVPLVPVATEWRILPLAAGTACAAAIIPAITAYRTDVSAALAGGA